MKLKLMTAFSVAIMIIVILSYYFSGNTKDFCVVDKDFNKSIYANTLPIEVAQCAECDVCGRELESDADLYLRKGHTDYAIKTYNEALTAYQGYLKYAPDSKCIKNGILRVKAKLRKLNTPDNT